MKILVKYPSRGRPKKLIQSLSKLIRKASDNDNIHYLLTIDNNDVSTNNSDFDEAIDMLKKHTTIQVERGTSTGKIHACNRDMFKAPKDWDIVMLMSDDMDCQVEAWDEIIRNDMKDSYDDLDGVLWYNDGYLEERLNTLCILSRKYFDRFGYIYNPNYKSLWCDNEFTEVGNMLGKQTYFDKVLFKHEHPANSKDALMDEGYRKTESFYYIDQKVYNQRKNNNFGL